MTEEMGFAIAAGLLNLKEALEENTREIRSLRRVNTMRAAILLSAHWPDSDEREMIIDQCAGDAATLEEVIPL